MPRQLYLYLTVVAAAYFTACVPQLSRISGRSPDLFEKETDRLAGGSRATGETPAPEMFVKQKRIAVTEADRPNETGSLFNPDNERNYLFTPTGPLNVGRFVKIQVAAAKDKPAGKDKDKDKAKAGAAKADAKTAKADAKGGDELETELLKNLPDLEPAEKGTPALLHSFKMQIVHRYDNGDIMVMLDRKSTREDHVNEVTVQARVPYDRLSTGDELTTDDLVDVHVLQNHEGEVAERQSSGWEDEYSLRLSGFSEAKSKLALELDDQKKKLKEAQEKTETRIKAFGEERRQFAKQRDDLNQKKAASDAKVQSLEEQVQEQQKALEAQNDQLKVADDPATAGQPGPVASGAGKPKAKPKAVGNG